MMLSASVGWMDVSIENYKMLHESVESNRNSDSQE